MIHDIVGNDLQLDTVHELVRMIIHKDLIVPQSCGKIAKRSVKDMEQKHISLQSGVK